MNEWKESNLGWLSDKYGARGHTWQNSWCVGLAALCCTGQWMCSHAVAAKALCSISEVPGFHPCEKCPSLSSQKGMQLRLPRAVHKS